MTRDLEAENARLREALADIKRYAKDHDDEWVPERVDCALSPPSASEKPTGIGDDEGFIVGVNCGREDDGPSASEKSDADLWRDLCEKGDRESPEGQPDMALINETEFYDYLAIARAGVFSPSASEHAPVRAWDNQAGQHSISCRCAACARLAEPDHSEFSHDPFDMPSAPQSGDKDGKGPRANLRMPWIVPASTSEQSAELGTFDEPRLAAMTASATEEAKRDTYTCRNLRAARFERDAALSSPSSSEQSDPEPTQSDEEAAKQLLSHLEDTGGGYDYEVRTISAALTQVRAEEVESSAAYLEELAKFYPNSYFGGGLLAGAERLRTRAADRKAGIGP